MKVLALQNGISFGRELRPDEMEQFNTVRDEAKKLVGQTGKSIFIVHDACLPQSAEYNTGLGNTSQKDAQEFFQYMKSYLGFNNVELLPNGELSSSNKLYCAYSGSALSLGNHQINTELLTHSEYENLLTVDEFKQIVKSNTSEVKETFANYKNVIEDGSPQDNALRIAYERFKKLGENNRLKQEFSRYVAENDEWLKPKGIYKVLAKLHGNMDYKTWDESIDKHLYESAYDFNERQNRINQIVNENSDEIDFVRFKQFIADKHLAEGRAKLNNMGVELRGDCEIGFSHDEVWANKDAFLKDTFIGCEDWKIASFDYDKLKNPDSAAAKLLKRKVQLCARRYDSIRFDVGWAYVVPKFFTTDKKSYSKYMGDDILKFIEQAVLEVKGKDYDLNNLIYEFEGGDIFKENSDQLLDPVRNRVKVFGSTFMHENSFDIWGSNDAFLRRGWSPDKFVIGVGNHDPQPLRQIANNIADNAMDDNRYHKNDAIQPLARILKLDADRLQDPVEFAKAKWAEPMMAKNNQMFYMDVFGREERFDMQRDNISVHPEKNYAYKIPADYRKQYHKAIQEGYGFNIMDALEKVFKAKNFDNTHPELYKQIVKFRDILLEKELPDVKNKYHVVSNQTVEQSAKKNKYFVPILTAVTFLFAVGTSAMYFTKKSKTEKS